MASNVQILGKGGDISFVGLCKNGHEIGELIYIENEQKNLFTKIKNYEILPDGRCLECGQFVFYNNKENAGQFFQLDCKEEDVERLKIHGLFWNLSKGDKIIEKLFFEGQDTIENGNFNILCNAVRARIIHKGNEKQVKKEHWTEMEELRQSGKITVKDDVLEEYLEELKNVLQSND